MFMITNNVLGFQTARIFYAPKGTHPKHLAAYTILTDELWDQPPTRVSGTLQIDLQQDIWGGLKKRCRNSITHAKSNGLTVSNDVSPEVAFNLHKDHASKKGFPTVSRENFKKENILGCYDGDELLCCGLFLHDDKYMRMVVNAVGRRAQGANNLLVWTALNIAKEKGLKIFDIGGYSKDTTKHPGIRRFKESFGGKFADIYIYNFTNSWLYGVLSHMKHLISK